MRWILPLMLCALAPSLSLASVDTDGDGLTDDWEMGYGRYQFIEGEFSWTEAKADAEARGGHLGTITSEQEHEFLRANFSGYADGSLRPWLGATDVAQEGVWKWVTGEQWNYTRWIGPPDNSYGGTQHYLWSGIGEPANQLWDDFGLSLEVLQGGPDEDLINCYLLEFGYPTDPFKADTDGDGYDDKVESDAGSDPNNPASTPVPPDADNDGVNNYREGKDGTDPNDANSFNPLSKGLVGYYPLDGDANDESGYGNSGIVNGAQAALGNSGIVNTALVFDGVDDFVEVPHSEVQRQLPITISVAFKTSQSEPHINSLVSKYYNDSFSGFRLGLSNGKLEPWYLVSRQQTVFFGSS